MIEVPDFVAAEATESIPCPVCDSIEYSVIFEAADYEYRLPGKFFIARCNGCGLQFQNPRPLFKDILRYYTEEYEPFKAVGSRWMQALRYQFLVEPRIRKFTNLCRSIERDINLIDVGCAHGDLLSELLSNPRFKCKGVEPVPHVAQIAKERGLDVECMTLEDYKCEDESFDIVVMNHVLEHLPNPDEVMTKVYRVLRKGGAFCGEVPCASALERIIFGRYWGMYHLPRHLTFFSKQQIVRFIEKHGFRDIKLHLQTVPSAWQSSVRNYMRGHGWNKGLTSVFSGHNLVLNLLSFPSAWLVAKLGFASIMHFTARK